MNTLRTIRAFFLATGSFLAGLLRRQDQILSRSASGYPILKDWPHSPEQNLRDRVARVALATTPKAALFCYDGNHRGEVFAIKNSNETLGTQVNHSLVLTPAQERSETFYQLFSDANFRLWSSPGASFQINGRERSESELYDYDHLEFLGNRFVFLELNGAVL